MAEVGRLQIRVMPDTSGFRSKLKAELKALQDSTQLKLKIDLDTAGLDAKVKAAAKAASKGSKVEVPAEIDFKNIRDSVKKESSKITAAPIHVPADVKFDSRAVFRESQRIAGDIKKTLDKQSKVSLKISKGLTFDGKAPKITVPVKLKIDSNAVFNESKLIGARIAATLGKSFTIKPKFSTGRHGTFSNIESDAVSSVSKITKFFTAAGKVIQGAFNSVGDTVSGIGDKVSKVGSILSNVGQVFSGILVAGLIAAIPALLGAIAIGIGAVESALLAVPGAISGFAIAMAAIKLATEGVGAAIKTGWSGSAKDFEKTLRSLAPAAQTFARAVVALKIPFKNLQQAIQQDFFAPFANSIEDLGSNLIPLLRTGLGGMATTMGKMVGEVTKFVDSSVGLSLLAGTFDGVNTAASNLLPAVLPLVDAFLRLSNASQPFWAQVADDIAKAATSFDNWVKDAEKSGELQNMFSNLHDLIVAIAGPLATLAAGIAKVFASGDTKDAIAQLGTTFGDSIRTFVKYLPEFITAFAAVAKILDQTLPFIIATLAAIGSFVSWLTFTAAPAISNFFGVTIPAAFNIMKNIFLGVAGILISTANGIMTSIIGFFVNGWAFVQSTTSRVWNTITGFLSSIWGTIQGIINNGVSAVLRVIGGISAIVGKVRGYFNGLAGAARGGIGALIGYVAATPGRILGALGNLGGLLFSAGQQVIQGFLNGIRSMIGSVAGALGSLTSMLPSWKGPPSTDKKILFNNGQLVIGGFIAGLESQYSTVKKSLGGLTSTLASTVVAPTLNPSVLTDIQTSQTEFLQATFKIDSDTIATATAKGQKRNTRRG